MYDKKYDSVVAMATYKGPKLSVCTIVEEMLFFWSSEFFSATTLNIVLSIVTEFV